MLHRNFLATIRIILSARRSSLRAFYFSAKLQFVQAPHKIILKGNCALIVSSRSVSAKGLRMPFLHTNIK